MSLPFSARAMSRRFFLPVLCVSGLGLWSAAIGNQAATPAALPVELRAHVQNERFEIVTSVRGLPLGVRDALQKLFGSLSLDIAEPGAQYQSAGATADSKLPTRRLVAAGCSIDHCLVYYERGGSTRTWRMALFHWTPDATRLECGGAVAGGLVTTHDLRRAILNGTISDAAGLW
jgi:hypothetical protein